uniref:Small ribosomal subunit protein uS3c n=1 Tax=Ravenala madagascariensis TaxID=4664 RepID=U6A2E0_9LILI|nr:ribosomal protein S3 [Ravenala madagascariensis]AHA12638.1 ribosomal protein S3 [Ravenala madagascariensis]
MGQKINPLGFRLGTTQRHHSFWFAQPKNYSVGLQEDERIRNCIKNCVQKIQKNRRISSGFEGIARIEIQKKTDLVQVIIYIGFPNLLMEGQTQGIKELRMNVQKELHSVNQRLNIAITKVEKPYGQPNILAEYIAFQLKNRVSFRKAVKKAIQLAKQRNTKGIRIQIAGRLGGRDIARVEWIRKGRIPLQTIRAKIDHGSYTIRTIHGVFGIKIWIFLD